MRVSVATLNRVVFTSPRDGAQMLALECKATLVSQGLHRHVRVRAQPFGGAVRILDPDALRHLLGEVMYDSPRSQSEQDFRILILPSDWEKVRDFCLQHLENIADPVLEAGPLRELEEEFSDALHTRLEAGQYTCQASGFVIENEPAPTNNVYAQGQPSVRIYRIFKVRLLDDGLHEAILNNSQSRSDGDLRKQAWEDARDGGLGRANAVLALPLETVIQGYLALPLERRGRPITLAGWRLDESVAAVLEEVEVPRYERVYR